MLSEEELDELDTDVVASVYEGAENVETWYKMVAMLQSGLDIKPIFTHRFGVRDFQKGFEIMISGNSGKVILDWTKI
jgi:threonine 3-dehydrogenase